MIVICAELEPINYPALKAHSLSSSIKVYLISLSLTSSLSSRHILVLTAFSVSTFICGVVS